MPNTPLLVDTHETPSTLKALQDVGLEYTLSDINGAGFGDFYWTSDDAVYNIEHKSANNLVRTFAGRPTVQLVRQFNAEYNNILLITGLVHAGPDGNCHIYRLNDRQGYYYPRHGDGVTTVPFSRWTGWKMAVMMAGIVIIEAVSLRDMANRLKALYYSTGKDLHVLTGHQSTIREESLAVRILTQFPEIGQVRAKQLLRRYGNLGGVFDATADVRDWPLTYSVSL